MPSCILCASMNPQDVRLCALICILCASMNKKKCMRAYRRHEGIQTDILGKATGGWCDGCDGWCDAGLVFVGGVVLVCFGSLLPHLDGW